MHRLLPVAGIIGIIAVFVVFGSQTAQAQDPLDDLESIRPPTALTAEATYDQASDSWQIELNWLKDNRNDWVTGYRIWRAENRLDYELLEALAPAEHQFLGISGEERYVDDDLLPGVQYFYNVHTVTREGVSKYHAKAVVETAATMPGLSATGGSGSVTLSWDDPEDATITGYRIRRSVNWGRESTRVSRLGASATSYVDRGLSAGAAYAYRVQMLRGSEVGPPSRYVTALATPRVTRPTGVSERSGRDLPADTTTTGLVRVGGSATGTIASETDVDWFAVDLVAGQHYFLRLRYEGEHRSWDGPVRIGCIRDDYGAETADHSLFPHFTNCLQSAGAFSPERSGRFYVPVSFARHGTEPQDIDPIDYALELRIDQTSEYITGGPPAWGSGNAQVGEWTSGEFHAYDTSDRYAVQLCGGRRYRIPVFHDMDIPRHGKYGPPSDGGPEPNPSIWITGPLRPEVFNPYTEPLIYRAQYSATHYIDLEYWYDEGPPLGAGHYRFLIEDLDENEESLQLRAVSEASGQDLPANRDTTGLLPFDQSVTGEIGQPGDVDWFAVRFNDRKCDRHYWFDLKGADTSDGTLADPYIVGLYDAAGSFIQYNAYPGPWDTPDNDSGVGKNARQAYVPSEPGLHYIAVRGRYRSNTGTYTLTLRDITDTSTSQEEGASFAHWNLASRGNDWVVGNLTPGIPATGYLNKRNNRQASDLWHLNVQNGRRYRITLEGVGSGPTARANDFTLLLPLEFGFDQLDSLGWYFAGSASIGEMDIRTYEFQATPYVVSSYDFAYIPVAWHFVVDGVRESLGITEWNYRLLLTDITDTESISELMGGHTTGRVAVGGSVTGRLDAPGDADWFRVDLEVGKTYRMRIRGAESGGGTLADPLLVINVADEPRIHSDIGSSTVSDTAGNDDTCKSSRDSVLTYTPREVGTYFVEAKAPDYGIGTYTVEVEEYAGNTPATGTPRINGTAQAGETLTAATSTICDGDGLSSLTFFTEPERVSRAQFSYQWLADGQAISGATSAEYMLTTAEEGKAITVTVSFRDYAGNSESVTSAATAVVTAAQNAPENNSAVGAPSISGTARVGETLTTATAGISDADGTTRATFVYEWLADAEAIDGATSATYVPTDGDVGKTITVTVSFTDDAGNPESLTSGATAAVAARAGLNVGTATVNGASLVLTYNEILDILPTIPTGAFAVSVSGASRSVSAVAIAGSSVTLTLGSAVPAGDTVTVGYTKPAGNNAVRDTLGRFAPSFTAMAVANETPPPPLTARASNSPSSHDGSATFIFELRFSEEPSLSYATLRDHAFTVTGGTVEKARRLTQGSNVGWEITVEPSGNGTVTVVLPATTDCTATGAICTEGGRMLSGRVEVAVPGPTSQQNQQQETQENNAATGTPTVSGTARVSETLTANTSGIADADGLDDATFSYQWIRVNSDATEADISGATGSTYTLVSGDAGKTVKVKVSFTDDGGNAESVTSAATGTVAAANNPATGSPTISGTARVDETLTASTSGIADADGLDNASFAYQWIRVNSDATEADIGGATGSTYTLASGDAGKTIKVRVSFTDDGGNAESLTSAATGTVARPLLTARASNSPSSHDGSATFTFELRFSEEFSLSYATLRDHAFTVTGGTVENARRLTQGSNVGWEITVEPSGNGTVTVVLPPTTDCAATGAICTEDGRKLSNETTVTVAGP